MLAISMTSRQIKKSCSQKINKLAAAGLVVCSTLTTSFLTLEPSQARSISNNSGNITPAKTQLIAQSRGNLSQFLRKLAIRETGRKNPPSDIENRLGFIGKFQFGEALLVDLGYYKSSPNPIYKSWVSNNPSKNLWKNGWTGKRGISSKRDFLQNKNKVQEVAMGEALALNCKYLNSSLQQKGSSINKYLGRKKNGVTVTTSGILAAAHLNGAQAAADLLVNGKVSRDENGTSIVAYLKEFGGYQIPSRYAGSCK